VNKADSRMFSKYYGRRDLDQDEGFWKDALETYRDLDVPLPMAANHSSIRMMLEYVDCKAGECGGCCSYHQVILNDFDLIRLREGGITNAVDEKQDNKKYMRCDNGCRYLKDKLCSIYRYRPDACSFFPLQILKMNEAMSIRIKCPNALNAIRQVVKIYLLNKYTLLPNLNLIKLEE